MTPFPLARIAAAATTALVSILMVLGLATTASAQDPPPAESVPLTITVEGPTGSSQHISISVADNGLGNFTVPAGGSIEVPALPGEWLSIFNGHQNDVALKRVTCTGDGGTLVATTEYADLNLRGTLPETTTGVECVLVYVLEDEFQPVPLNLTFEGPDARPIAVDVLVVGFGSDSFQTSSGETITVNLSSDLTATARPLGNNPQLPLETTVTCTGASGLYSSAGWWGATVHTSGGPVAKADSVDCVLAFEWPDSVVMTAYGPYVTFSTVTDQGASHLQFSGQGGRSDAFPAPYGGSLQITADTAGTIRCSSDNRPFATSELVEGVAHLSTTTPAEPGFIQCIFVPELDGDVQIYPTVTCLAGNGRIDVNVQTPYRLEFTLRIGGLAPRVRTLEAGDWWRSPVTGQRDGPIPVELTVYGVTILQTTVEVECDGEPAVTSPEVQPIVACRGGSGFVLFQFANPTAASRGYVIEFEGVRNRSTTAAAYGAAVRGVSGRQDGTYEYRVTVSGQQVATGAVTIDC